MREGLVFKPQPIGYRVKGGWGGKGIEGLRRDGRRADRIW